MTSQKSKIEELKSLIGGFAGGLMLGTIIMIAVILQWLEASVQRELVTVLLTTLGCSIVTLIAGIRLALSKKEK